MDSAALVRRAATVVLVSTPLAAAVVLSLAEGGHRAWPIGGYLLGTLFSLLLALRTAVPHGRRKTIPPQELPAPPPQLLGRAAEVGEAVGFLRSAPAAPHRLVVISGPPGIGKTSLALHVAHHVAADYPDGQLYASMDARGDDPGDVLRRTLIRFLRATGRPVDDADPDTLRDEFRRLVSTKRLLVLLDDVSGVDIGALAPEGALGATVITSRRPPGGLGPHLPVRLGPLPEEAAVGLLRNIVGDDRVTESADSEAAAGALVHACALHPLAVQFAGAALVARPSADIALVLSRAHLPERRDTGDYLSALDFGYQLLTRRDQDAVLSLGRLERRFQPWMLAEETDLDEKQARWLADRLSAAQFVERSTVDAAGVPIYETVEHVLDFAKLRAGADRSAPAGPHRKRHRDPADEQRLQTYELLDQGKLSKAYAAARDALALARESDRPGSAGLALAALAELRAEVGGTDEVVDLADQAWHDDAPKTRARVSRVMGHIQRRVRRLDIAGDNLCAATAYARAAGDDDELIRVLTELALVRRLGHRPEQALAQAAEARRLAGGFPRDRERYLPRILLAEAMTLTTLGRRDEAADRFAQARERADEQNFQLWRCWIDYREAQLRLQSGEPDRARELALEALSRFTRIRHRYGTGHCRLLLGRIHFRDGDPAGARTLMEDALETFRNCGDRWIEGNAAAELAHVHLREGSLQQARDALRRARRLRTGQRYWMTYGKLIWARCSRAGS